MPKYPKFTDEERREKKNKRDRELYNLKGRTRTPEQLQALREKAKNRYYRLTDEQMDAKRESGRKSAKKTYNKFKSHEWRKNNRERDRLNRQQYRKKNIDRLREYDREWKKNLKFKFPEKHEAVQKRARVWRENNPEKYAMQLERASARHAKWQKDNPEKYAMRLERQKEAYREQYPDGKKNAGMGISLKDSF